MTSPAAAAILNGMPHPADLRVRRHDGETFVTAGQMVIACYPDGDVAMRNVAVAVARQLGFSGQRVAEVMGLSASYVATLHQRALREGAAGLVRPSGPKPKLSPQVWAGAAKWRQAGVSEAQIAARLEVAQATVSRHLGGAGQQELPASETAGPGEPARAAGPGGAQAERVAPDAAAGGGEPCLTAQVRCWRAGHWLAAGVGVAAGGGFRPHGGGPGGAGGRERAKSLLWAAGKLADYAFGLGLEPVPEVLLHPSVTGRFTVSAPGLSGPARRTLRTNLRFLARRVVPALAPADAPLPRESVSDILCAGFFPVRYQMFIRYSFFALSDVLVPVLFSGSGESGFPCCSWADAACPGFLPVVLVPGAAALSLPDHLAAVPVGDLNIADSDGRGG